MPGKDSSSSDALLKLQKKQLVRKYETKTADRDGQASVKDFVELHKAKSALEEEHENRKAAGSSSSSSSFSSKEFLPLDLSFFFFFFATPVPSSS